jgi:hypothetical protein
MIKTGKSTAERDIPPSCGPGKAAGGGMSDEACRRAR